MSNLVNQPTGRTARKVSAARNGAGIGALIGVPVGNIVAGFLAAKEPFFADYIVEISTIIAALVSSGSAWASGYYARERLENMVISDV